MADIYLSAQPIMEALSDTFNNNFQSISEWMGRAVQWIQTLPKQMQDNPNTALAVFITTNSLFFMMINSIANGLEERVNSAPQELDVSERRFNRILIDYLLVGISFLAFNIFISNLMRYSLNYSTFAAITITAIVIRTLLHSATELL